MMRVGLPTREGQRIWSSRRISSAATMAVWALTARKRSQSLGQGSTWRSAVAGKPPEGESGNGVSMRLHQSRVTCCQEVMCQSSL